MSNLFGIPEAKTECRKCAHLKRLAGLAAILYGEGALGAWQCCKTQTPHRLSGDERLHINEVGCMSFDEEPPGNRVKVD